MVTISNNSATGYTFKAWTTLENGKGKSYKDGTKVTNLGGGGGETHLYAQWTPNKYTVVFHANAENVGMVLQNPPFY